MNKPSLRTTKIVAAFLLVALVASLITYQWATASFQGSLESLPFYVGAPQPYSYVIDTNGTHYFGYNGTTGFLEQTSTNASYVVNSVIAANVSLGFTSGTFIFDSDIDVGSSFVTIFGQGFSTVFKASSAINVIHCTVNNKFVVLRDFLIDGNNVATKGISWMGYYGLVENIWIQYVNGIGFDAVKPTASGNNLVDNKLRKITVRNCSTGFYWGSGPGLGLGSDNYFQDITSFYNDGDGIILNGSSSQAWNLNSYNNGGNGIVIPTCDLKLISGVADGNGENGVYFVLSGVWRNLIEAYSIKSNSKDSAGTYDGIFISGNGSYVLAYVTIKDCMIRDENLTAPKTQNYAIRGTYLTSGSVVEVIGGRHSGNLQDAPWSFSSSIEFKVRDSLDPITENNGFTTVANDEYIAHGIGEGLNIAQTNSCVLITPYTATYGSVPVVVGCLSVNATHIMISVYWTNGTAITADAIQIWWSVKYGLA